MAEFKKPSAEPESPPSPPPEHNKPDPSANHGQQKRHERSVFQYITILFAAAFVLMLFTFLMERRANLQQIDDLQKNSLSATQRLEDIIDQRDQLKKDKQQLSDQLSQAQWESRKAEDTIETQSNALQAMDWFWRIQRQYSRGYITAARELASGFEDTGLPAYLPEESYADPEAPSPKEQYQELYNLLF